MNRLLSATALHLLPRVAAASAVMAARLIAVSGFDDGALPGAPVS